VSIKQEIRLRFNTDFPKNPQLLPWRVLVGSNPNSLQEIPAGEVTFNTPSWDTTEVLPGVGRKWHITCSGILTQNGTQLTVSSPSLQKQQKQLIGVKKQLGEYGMVRVNFNPRHVDFPEETPAWQGLYGGNDEGILWSRVRVSHVLFNVLSLTTRTVLTSGPKWHFGGYGIPSIVSDENEVQTLVVDPR